MGCTMPLLPEFGRFVKPALEIAAKWGVPADPRSPLAFASATLCRDERMAIAFAFGVYSGFAFLGAGAYGLSSAWKLVTFRPIQSAKEGVAACWWAATPFIIYYVAQRVL